MAQAFSTLDAWCRRAHDEEPLIAAFEGLHYTLHPARKHEKVPPQFLFLNLKHRPSKPCRSSSPDMG